MPSAPNFSQSMAAFVTSGILPPLALRIVAILLILMLSFVISLQKLDTKHKIT
jgi:hypothetical protein